jgi:hypothetical protein
MLSMMENEEMGKEFERFESEMKSGDTKGILYKEDSEMEGLIALDYLNEKYGKENISRILNENSFSVSDLSVSDIFLNVCKIALGNI